MSVTYDESKHNRAGDGKFATKDGGREAAGQVADAFAEGPECCRCETSPCSCDNPLPDGIVNDSLTYTHEDEYGRPHFEMSFAKPNGQSFTCKWGGPAGSGDPDPEEVLAYNATDYRTIVDECGGSYAEFRAMGLAGENDETVDVDEMDDDDIAGQSPEWQQWKRNYDEALANLDIDDDDAVERFYDDQYSSEPYRRSKGEAEFQRSVEQLEAYRGLVGEEQHQHFLKLFDEKYN